MPASDDVGVHQVTSPKITLGNILQTNICFPAIRGPNTTACRQPVCCIRRNASSSMHFHLEKKQRGLKRNRGLLDYDRGLVEIKNMFDDSPYGDAPRVRDLSKAGTRDDCGLRQSMRDTSRIGVSAETLVTLAIGTMTCRTRRLGRSSTRLIITFSSRVKSGAASCMTKRNSSRLPNSRPVCVRPPSNAAKLRENQSATTETSGGEQPSGSNYRNEPGLSPARGGWDTAGRPFWLPAHDRM